MKESLLKSVRYGQIVDVMYMAKSGEVTKRRIKVLKLYGESFQAYCFLRNKKRTFKVDNVLALIPVMAKERTVV
ncbi:MAG: transcriptional regulator [Paenisporosarcina sp.]